MYTIGIDLGGTNVAVGLCDEELKIVEKISRPTVNADADSIVKQMADISAELIKKHSLTLEDILYVGVTAPGTVRDDGVVEYAPNLPFVNYDIASKFREFLPVKKVYAANDANAAALGEFLAGGGKGAKSLIMITLGTGVGGGIILDGKIFSGALNTSGAELGHTVIVRGGRECGCGRRGCLETYASATGLRRSTKEKLSLLRKQGKKSIMFDDDFISARTPFNAAKAGDKAGLEVVKDYIDYLACGITNFINIFQPEILLVGGGVAGEGEYLIAPLREIVNAEQYTKRNEIKTKIAAATLGNDAGIIGAAGLGRQ